MRIPARLSPSGRRTNRYFATKREAENFARELSGDVASRGVEGVLNSGLEAWQVAWAGAGLSGDVSMGVEWLIRECGRVGSFDGFVRRFERGDAEFSDEGKSVTWLEASREFMRVKRDVECRRERTLRDLRLFLERIEKRASWVLGMFLCDIGADECSRLLDVFPTPRQRLKVRRGLSGLFSLGMKRGWCRVNGFSLLDSEVVRESELRCLSVDEVQNLVGTAREFRQGVLLAPVAMMVFAGIRPEEVKRLKWEDVDFEEGVISVRGHSSKTGGTRHVEMSENLRRILISSRGGGEMDDLVVSVSWESAWKALIRVAGWGEKKKWPQDACRHTFASYHLKKHGDLQRLQVAMGHRSSELLRTRYLNMRGVTKALADEFWCVS